MHAAEMVRWCIRKMKRFSFLGFARSILLLTIELGCLGFYMLYMYWLMCFSAFA